MIDLGIVTPGTKLYIPFQTFDSNDPSASTTITGLATTDIEIYKDGSVTQRASDAGYALLDTDGIDFDTTTGIHGISIDLADNTTAGFYASGSQYWVVIASITVDAATINFIPVTFRIGYPGALLNTTVATLASQTSFTLTSGSADDDAYNGWKCLVHDVASGIQMCLGYVSDYTGTTKTVTLAADPGIFTMAATDNVALFPPDNMYAIAGSITNAANIGTAGSNYSATRGLTGTALPAAAADAAGGVPISDAGGLDLDGLNTNVSAVLADTGTDGVVVAAASKTGYRLSATGVDDIFDEALSGHVTAGSFGAAMYVIRSNTAQAGASTTITLDASASATDDFYNNQRIFIVSGTGAGQGSYVTDYVGSTKVATVQDTWRVNPSSDSVFVIVPAGGIPGASAPTAGDNAAAVWDAARSSHTTEGSFGALFYAPHEGTAQAATSTSFTLDATGSSSTDDFYNYAFIKVIAGTGAGQSRQISDYNGTTKVATVSLAWTTTPSTDSQYVVMTDFGIDAATTAQIAAGVWNAARATYQSAGTFGEYVYADALRISGAATAADGLEAAVAGTTPLPANVTQISGDSVAADNLESYTDGTTPMPVNATQISGDATAADNLEAAFDGTGGVTISANLNGYAEIRTSGGSAGDNTADLVSAILTTQMTESYNTDGTAPTLAQALFLLTQRLTESEVSGTTLTVKRLDGSTSAYTITLDDGTNPTTMTRAT